MFIPLGFAEYAPERPYTPEDPEYQAYLRFKKDPKKPIEGKREFAWPVDLLCGEPWLKW